MQKEYAQYLLEKTKGDYSLIAQDFSRTRKEPWPEVKFLFDNYLILGEKILDLGCGNARFLPFFEEARVDYVGVDVCPELIEIAKQKYPKRKFYIQNAQNLSFPNNFFDKVYSIAVLHHIPSEQFRIQFLKEARRVLKPKGLLVLTVWKLHHPKELFSLFKYTLQKAIGKSELDYKDIFQPWGKKAHRYYHWFSKKELQGLMVKAGFKVKKSGLTRNARGNRQNIYIVAEKV